MSAQRLRKIAGWVLFSLLGVFFVMMGVNKFLVPAWAEKFMAWGYPAFFYAVIGVVELTGGVGMFIPRFRAHAALILLLTMLGALLTHIVHAESPNIVVTAVLSLITGLVAYAHRGSLSLRVKESTQHMTAK